MTKGKKENRYLKRRYNTCNDNTNDDDVLKNLQRKQTQVELPYLFPSKPLYSRVWSTSLLKTPWAKGEIARNEQFLLFPHCFLLFCKMFLNFHQI